MRVGILGSRGIPNNYGGFEQFAQYLAQGLVDSGVDVWVYSSHSHPFKESVWQKVNIVHCLDPENKIGQLGQFIYDLNCINDSRSRDFDIVLQLGYTSNSIWHKLLPRKAKIITNMDGLEWKRSKYSKTVRKFLKYAERLAVVSSDLLVADSEVIQSYLYDEYGAESTYIPYGATVCKTCKTELLDQFGVEPKSYFLVIARLQTDNHIEETIDGFVDSGTDKTLLVVGNYTSRYGNILVKKYASQKNIKFLGSIFDIETLNTLRANCLLYFHGHSSGGTNPSLLEAMASSAIICAHDNPFSRSILGNDALYFKTASDISLLIQGKFNESDWASAVQSNIQKIQTKYSWGAVINSYFDLFNKALSR